MLATRAGVLSRAETFGGLALNNLASTSVAVQWAVWCATRNGFTSLKKINNIEMNRNTES